MSTICPHCEESVSYVWSNTDLQIRIVSRDKHAKDIGDNTDTTESREATKEQIPATITVARVNF
jgi:hypothetical protein